MTSKQLATRALRHLEEHVEQIYAWKKKSSFQNGEEAHELANILTLLQREVLELQQLVSVLDTEEVERLR